MIPRQADIEVPLLQTLLDLGGKARPKEVLNRILKYFPALTESDRAQVLIGGGNRWENRIAWARQALVWKGEMGPVTRCVGDHR